MSEDRGGDDEQRQARDQPAKPSQAGKQASKQPTDQPAGKMREAEGGSRS